MAREVIRRWVAKIAPRSFWRWRAGRWQIDVAKASLLPKLAIRTKLSIDVGAANGAYTALLIPLSRRVVAFEPTPVALAGLRKLFEDTTNVTIEPVALSDRSGVTNMRVVPDRYWRSTIEPLNALKYTPDVVELAVQTRDWMTMASLRSDSSRSMSRAMKPPC